MHSAKKSPAKTPSHIPKSKPSPKPKSSSLTAEEVGPAVKLINDGGSINIIVGKDSIRIIKDRVWVYTHLNTPELNKMLRPDENNFKTAVIPRGGVFEALTKVVPRILRILLESSEYGHMWRKGHAMGIDVYAYNYFESRSPLTGEELRGIERGMESYLKRAVQRPASPPSPPGTVLKDLPEDVVNQHVLRHLSVANAASLRLAGFRNMYASEADRVASKELGPAVQWLKEGGTIYLSIWGSGNPKTKGATIHIQKDEGVRVSVTAGTALEKALKPFPKKDANTTVIPLGVGVRGLYDALTKLVPLLLRTFQRAPPQGIYMYKTLYPPPNQPAKVRDEAALRGLDSFYNRVKQAPFLDALNALDALDASPPSPRNASSPRQPRKPRLPRPSHLFQHTEMERLLSHPRLVDKHFKIIQEHSANPDRIPSNLVQRTLAEARASSEERLRRGTKSKSKSKSSNDR